MPKTVNIVQLIPSIGFGGGAENLLLDLARFMDKRFRISVLYWEDPDDLSVSLREAGARVERLALGKVVSVGSVRSIAAALKAEEADILHTHFMDADLMGFVASRLAGVPMVTHIHRYPFPSMPRHAVRYRVMSAGISRFICVSAHASAHLITYAGIPPDKVEVVHNGVDRSRFIRARLPSERLAVRKALGFSKEDVIIGNVSRLVENKGHDVFLKAALMVLTRRSDARFLIVGDGPQRAGLELLARQLGIAGQVLFAGARHDIADLLSVMDAFAFPAHHEGFGLSLVEAMASGVPVVASNDSAIPEIIRDEQEGILFSPGDERALAQALLRLVNDRALPGRLAAAALKRSEQFSCQTTARKLENIYDEVLRR